MITKQSTHRINFMLNVEAGDRSSKEIFVNEMTLFHHRPADYYLDAAIDKAWH